MSNYSYNSRYKVGVIYFLRTHICYTSIEDESKLSSFDQVNQGKVRYV